MVLHQRMHGVRVSEAVECNHADLVIMLHYNFCRVAPHCDQQLGLHISTLHSFLVDLCMKLCIKPY